MSASMLQPLMSAGGGIAGSALGPVGTMAGSTLGGMAGGMLGAPQQPGQTAPPPARMAPPTSMPPLQMGGPQSMTSLAPQAGSSGGLPPQLMQLLAGMFPGMMGGGQR